MPISSDHDRLGAAPLETLADATGYLDGLINRERRSDYAYSRLDLRPIEALLDGIGRPDRSLSVIHVAGSKGKGSTCLLTESILLALGERVGTFTSPHLESWVERFRIDGVPIDEARLVAAVERVRPVVEVLRSGAREFVPSFFDATTAVAFLVFAEAGVDRAVIEVGLGGRLDSTNVVAPAVTCITSIELEHTDKLGHTEAAIAGEKAGIIKSDVPVVLGLLRPEAERVIRARAKELGAPVVALGEVFRIVDEAIAERREATPLILEADGHPRLVARIASPGRIARLNAALAIACVRTLGVYDPVAIAEASVRALANCRLPARVERLAQDPRVLVDAAHTEESARALAEALTELAPGGFELLISISSDKDLDRVVRPLLAGAHAVWATRADPSRSLPAADLAARIEGILDGMGRVLRVECVSDPELASRRAREGLSEGRLLVAAGSVYLAGIARRVLGTRRESKDHNHIHNHNHNQDHDAEVVIGLAGVQDAAACPEIERRAATLYSSRELLPEAAERTSDVAEFVRAQRDGRLIAARIPDGRLVGFAFLTTLGEGGSAHLEEIDVEPVYGRRGIGARLVTAACGWAYARGDRKITLTTFRDVPWNAPFYARMGFEIVPEAEWTEEMRRIRQHEKAEGLDPERRVVMQRSIGSDDAKFVPS